MELNNSTKPINPNELRLGNYLRITNESGHSLDVRVSNITSTFLDFENDGQYSFPEQLFYQISYIPLDEELLLKCGFESGTDDGNHWWFTKGDATINYSSWTAKFEWEWQDIEIMSLHQLQNLYFTLTNKELSINL